MLDPVGWRNMVAPSSASDPKLLPAAEARELGVARSTISRARQDPTHPANSSPNAEGVAPHRAAPRSEILAWHANRERMRPGPAASRSVPPGGLTSAQWSGLQVAAAGQLPGTAVRNRLTERGILDEDGQVTVKGRQLLDQAQGES
jgi:hypothetical protein